ncbi:hypothetical protein COCON_G00049630 [Conger conger]|uniref:Plasma membrane ascorbate-dependent reductase CYBRD1 n=1 Tax=Conger conger TaxID=82655 RepID=A0A9Q1DVM5_CONCO|nr:hypothetical protein COCON_G00049630 [Conger conger]
MSPDNNIKDRVRPVEPRPGSGGAEEVFVLGDTDSDLGLYGFGSPVRLDRDATTTSKSTGGGVCLYVNERWCKSVNVRDKICTADVELLTVALRPHYLPPILVYRLPWTWKCSKLMMKFIHAGLNILAFAFAAISLVAVFDFHNAASIPNMYSLHSWLGLTAVILYGLQIALGLCVYLVPIIPESMRAVFMPVHVYSGLLIFTSVIATALMGITEKLIFGLKNPKYKDSPPEATFVNFLGVLIMVFGALVIWIVTCPAWKRPNEQLLSSQPTSGGDATRTMGGTVLSICSTTDWNDPEANCDTRKRNNKPDQSGQRSTV